MYKDCSLMKCFFTGGSKKWEQKKKPEAEANDAREKDGSFPSPDGYLMIFNGPEAYGSKRRQKLTHQEVYEDDPAMAAFLKWSGSPITFDRSDHPDSVTHLGRYPLMVDPIIGMKRLTKVLMDGGSGLNIMYAETLDAMDVHRSCIHPTRAPFHGIMPGKQAILIGQIDLPVTFGNLSNYRIETLTFKEGVLIDFLYANRDIFAWKPLDMPGIPREVIEHALKIRPGSRLVKQCLRRFNKEKRRLIGEEITKLLVDGFIKEVYHPEWLSNPILVKKKSGKWQMCVDYTSLNKACLKDSFPLPCIDQVVDSTLGCETLCFLDAYSRYNQIMMKEFDQLTTSFITSFGSFYDVMMPFELKNIEAMYQRCMTKCFRDLIRWTVEAYVDDIIVKSKQIDQLVADLEQTFRKLRENVIKLNPKKCVFGVQGACCSDSSSPSMASKPIR
ncbi:uncharacterized protein [Miscanthus floridulus]|uniref:uncharacterized protein n=1 Tax=Miscanthus floridulus TaxID=154761 RepID=UPI00345A8C83